MLEPLHRFPVAARRAVRAVLTDIDDTLTDHGRLPVIAYDAMTRLQKAGICVVPVTGRPAGWCDLIARQWPITGVVGENGAFFFRYDDATRTMTRRYAKDEPARSADRRRLDQIRQAVLAQVPGAAVSADQAYRDADLAIDFCEDVAPLPASAVKRIVEIFEQSGATAKISSIHVNGWFGGYDKLTTSKTFLREVLGLNADGSPETIAYIGDSPNDVPMFEFFRNSVGVANVLDFRAQLATPPRWVTTRRGGHGFAEFADALIAARESRL
jgi:HAD superfamily hydrolase (TIGR01484 family)